MIIRDGNRATLKEHEDSWNHRDTNKHTQNIREKEQNVAQCLVFSN